MRGMTPLEELEERNAVKKAVILECEEERARLLTERGDGGTSSSAPPPISPALPKSFLETQSPINRTTTHQVTYREVCNSIHSIIKIQMRRVQQLLHEEALALWKHKTGPTEVVPELTEALLLLLNERIKELWPSSFIEIYGSYVTKLSSQESDIDIVVCFSDSSSPTGNKSLAGVRGMIPLLQTLAEFLHTHNIVHIDKLILHARVPVIQATAMIFDPGDEAANILPGYRSVLLDISIESPAHTGIPHRAWLESSHRYLLLRNSYHGTCEDSHTSVTRPRTNGCFAERISEVQRAK